jgi:hypothetical protein
MSRSEKLKIQKSHVKSHETEILELLEFSQLTQIIILSLLIIPIMSKALKSTLMINES